MINNENEESESSGSVHKFHIKHTNNLFQWLLPFAITILQIKALQDYSASNSFLSHISKFGKTIQ